MLSKQCPQCNKECALADQFCDNCGHQFPQEKAAAPLEELRKHATVLVAEIRDPTGFIAGLDPEKAHETLSPAIQKLSSIVYEYGGTVISSVGNKLTAVFGAPQILENHALRACLAALAMQKQIKSINAALFPSIGLNSGEILLAVEGAKYDIAGAPVHLAAHMEQTAKPGTIYLTQNTLKLVAKNVIAESLGPQQIKGFDDLIETFELKGVEVSKSLYEWTCQFLNRTSFVDREEELAKIGSLLLDAKKGSGNAVGLCADAGLGKSRFVYEVINSEAGRHCNILLTSAFIHTKDIPLLPIKNLFRYLFGIMLDENNAEEIKKKIDPFLSSIHTPYAISSILSLLNLTPSQPEWTSLDPGLKRRYMFETGVQILLATSQQKPLVIIFEDMHWVDGETEVFLDALFSQIPKFKIFTISTYRPQYRDHWIGRPGYTQILLSPLPKPASSEMVDNILGQDPSLAEVKTKLLSTVGGNPFFLEETTLSLIAEKVFVGEPRKYRLREAVAIHEIHLPETIATAIQSKIDALPPLEKKLLLVASAIGKKFLYSQLIQLVEAADISQIRSALNRLCKEQYIYEAQLYPEPGFIFMYDLTSEVAYNSILKKNRKDLHLKIFEILEKTLQEDQIDQLQIVADHAYLGENWAKAFYYSIKAAEKVYEINAFTPSAKLYERALTIAVHLPEDEALPKKIMALHYALYYVYVPLGRFNEQYEHLQKALAIAIEEKNRFFESIIYSAFCIHYMGYKDVHESLQYAEKAYVIAKGLQSIDAIAIAQFSLIHINFFLTNFNKLFEVYDELEKTVGGNVEFRSPWLKLPIVQIARTYDSWSKAFKADFPALAKRTEKWLTENKNLEQPSISNVCLFSSLTTLYYFKGEFEKALPYALKTVQYCLSTEFMVYFPIFCSILGNIYGRLNKIEEAKKYTAQAIAVAEKIHINYVSVSTSITASDSLIVLGKYEEAKKLCYGWIKIMEERKILSIRAALIRLSADIDLSLPNPNYNAIKQKLEECLPQLTSYDLWCYVARCHLSFAELYRQMGNEENRKKSLNTALSYFEKFEMPYWTAYTKKLITTPSPKEKAS